MKYYFPDDHWLKFCFLLIVLFLLKGIVYLSIMPPFEGWDEYQHVAYLSYIDKYNQRPVLNDSFVSRDLLRQIVQFPVPQAMKEQIGTTGAVDYSTFYQQKFTGIHYNSNHKNISLYQAQHGSLYYRIILPVARLFSGEEQLLNKIYILRTVNILFVTISLAMILWLLNKIVFEKKHAAVIAILFISQPLLLLNACRVANDALAIMTGTLVVTIGLLPKYRKKISMSLAVGFLIGISCWAKSTSFILFPFWCCCIFISLLKKEITLKRSVYILFISIFIALIFLGKYFYFNVKYYGMLIVMQESIVNKNNNKVLLDILRTFFDSPLILMKDILVIWLKNSIWIGGWSFLRVRDIGNISAVLISFSFFGMISNLFFKRKRKGIISSETSFLCFSIFLFTSFSLSWHYLQSVSAWGKATTCPWYISMSLPFFLLFIYDSAHRFSSRTSIVVGSLLTAVYIYADIKGSLTMICFYSGDDLTDIGEALSRISLVHPIWLGTFTFITASILFIALLLYITHNYLYRSLLAGAAQEGF